MPRTVGMVSLVLGLGYSPGLSRRGLPAKARLEAWAALPLDRRRGRFEIGLRLVDEVEGRNLNREFRGKDHATNVLSFPAGYSIGERRYLGDIALCVPVLAREAAEQGKTLADHCAHLLVHGVLHLLGHDHQDEVAAHAMETIERRLLARLGIADPYGPQGPRA
ncbi:MAG TPA: rRNA maturation RNase YbeY [Xanthomonadaceae bacterium]|nr:rRNA maturation RNase YbeY [Xanthomonadaceae bacterium]